MEIIKIYMKEIEGIGRLSEKDEDALADMIENGTEEEKEFAINELVVSNLKLVIKIANCFTKDKTVDFEDIVSYGNIGLMRAAKRFKKGCGAKFSTHASWWIKQAIKRYLDSKDMIRIPSAYNQKFKRFHRIKSDFELINGREPTDDEMSEITGYSKNDIKKIKSIHNRVESLDAIVGEGGSLHNVISDGMETSYWTDEKEELVNKINEIINGFSDNEKYVIIKRFGLDGSEPEKLEKISEKIGKTAERVRQIQNESLNKIRRIIKEDE